MIKTAAVEAQTNLLRKGHLKNQVRSRRK